EEGEVDRYLVELARHTFAGPDQRVVGERLPAALAGEELQGAARFDGQAAVDVQAVAVAEDVGLGQVGRAGPEKRVAVDGQYTQGASRRNGAARIQPADGAVPPERGAGFDLDRASDHDAGEGGVTADEQRSGADGGQSVEAAAVAVEYECGRAGLVEVSGASERAGEHTVEGLVKD